MSDLETILGLNEIPERAADMSEACKAILDLAFVTGKNHGGESHALWLLMTSVAIACRAVNVTPKQCASAMRGVRKSVDESVAVIGEESADVQSIIVEMHLR